MATNKKRKRVDDGDEGHAISRPLNAIESLEENESREEPSRSASGASKDNPNSSKSGIPITKNNIPEFLPVEYLEDEPAEDQGSFSLPKQTMSHKSKKIKFIDPTPKKPKDRRKGSTIYRVAEAQGSGLLAPKAARNARSVKEAWLNGQRGAGGTRKVVNGAFVKSRK